MWHAHQVQVQAYMHEQIELWMKLPEKIENIEDHSNFPRWNMETIPTATTLEQPSEV